jgi:hypothetical protein
MNLIFTYLSATLKYVKGERMDTQNITLAVPKKILAKFKEIAFRQQKSVSGLMVEIMEEKVGREEGYRLAQERYQRRMAAGMDLQTQGNLRCDRDDLHER